MEEACLSRHLVMFARLPVPGRVKTRLAAGLGAEAACRFYAACAERVLKEGGPPPVPPPDTPGEPAPLWTPTLHFSDAAEADGIRGWLSGMGLVSSQRRREEGSQ